MSVTAGVTARLAAAPAEVLGRFADASNATLLVRLTDRDPRPVEQLARELGRTPTLDDLDAADLAVYKPARGEVPLWDFPAGTLHRREVAAYEISRALGLDLVPETVLREDGPAGPGSMQRFVAHDPEEHYFTLLDRDDPGIRAELEAMVVLDLVIDNADRKAGHVLLEQGAAGPPRVRVVDHGVCFNVEDKLRTVAWDLAGAPVPDVLRTRVAALVGALDGPLGPRLEPLLSAAEREVLRERARRVAGLERFPPPSGPRPYPWPLL